MIDHLARGDHGWKEQMTFWLDLRNPFNAVNLTLTVGVTNYNVNNVLTGFIFGTGLFTIQATATQLIFTATGDGYTGAADLDFSDGGASDNRYVIGSDADPHFEGAVTGAGNVFANSAPVYPLVWATAATSVPEPSTLTLFGLGLAGLGLMRRRRAA